MKTTKSFSLSSRALIYICAAYFAFILNASFWRYIVTHIEITDLASLVFAFSFPAAMFMAGCLVFCLLLWPYAAKPVLVVLLIASSIANHVMYQYGIYIDSNMIRNVVQTHPEEAFDLMTLTGVVWVAATGVVPALILLRCIITFQPTGKELRHRAAVMLTCLLIITGLAALTYKSHAAFGRNNSEIRRLINTGNYVYATFRYFQKKQQAKQPFVHIDPQAKRLTTNKKAPTVFIMVMGETARAANFSLNGYSKKTNPQLEKHDIINFQHVIASGTDTAFALPALFSPLPRKKFNADASYYSENLLDILQQSEYDMLWRENDNGCKGVCDRVPTQNMIQTNNPQWCDGDVCYDEILLEGLKERLQTVTTDTFIVLHTIGSHGPTYYKRYPDTFKLFGPTCDSADIQHCTQEEIINTYDNTIAYTDHVVASAIDILKEFPNLNSGLLYISDHGESLGENNIYLHGMPYAIAPKEQVHVPMVLWMSQTMQHYNALDMACLANNAKNNSYSHDNLFHSLAGLMEIDTVLYDPSLDLFQSCSNKTAQRQYREELKTTEAIAAVAP